jgi:hypothetical protein
VKLIDLDPRWFTVPGSDDVVGITFDCPHCRDQRLGVEFDAGIDRAHRHPGIVYPVPPDGKTHWHRTGKTFETLTLSPSIDASAHVALARLHRERGGDVTAEERSKSRISWLDVPAFFRLDYCCQGLLAAFGNTPYLVGSCLERPDFRDVDVSLMLPDEQFAAMFPNQYALLFLNAAVSDWLSERTGLRIDFKFQDTTTTNEKHRGKRNALGVRDQIFNKEKAQVW